MNLTLEHRKFTADEYLQMGEAGVLLDSERIELIDGEIVPMAPIGNRHNASVDRIVASFPPLVGKRGIVRIQGSFRLNGKSMPEPDLLVLEPRADFYEAEAATAEDVMLIGEVSESSLEYDRGVKLPLYARHGLKDYWLLNLIDRRIEVYRFPSGDTYRYADFYRGDDTISPLAFPDLSFRVADLIGG